MSFSLIILADGQGERLKHLKAPKPLAFVFGEPLLAHLAKHAENAGAAHIAVVSRSHDQEIKEALLNAGISRPVSVHPTLAAALREANGRGAYIGACDLVFEENPFKAFQHKGDVEVLIDKHLAHNAFAGADNAVKTTLGGKVLLGAAPHDKTAHLIPLFFANPRAVASLDKAQETAHPEELIIRLADTHDVRSSMLPQMLWYDVNTPETLMRAEMLLRRQNQAGRRTNVAVDDLEVLPPRFDFSYERRRTTDVIIERGLLKRLGSVRLMDPERTASAHVIITDETVDPLYGDAVLSELRRAGYSVEKLVAPAGEAAKRMDVYERFAERIIALGIDEHSVIFSLGGGAVANVAGFLAATLYRGIGLIHLPTTLMCMLDVAISLKQGINSEKGKNLVGAYFQPLAVFIDPDVAMPETLIRHGLSEAIKHAFAQDRPFFDFLMEYDGKISDPAFVEEVIRRTIGLKIELMQEDMFENNRAIVLQYGHEVGHAVEFLSGFKLSHGEAISIGMRVSAEISHLMSVTGKETVDAHKALLQKYGLPITIPAYLKKDAVLDALKFNKKTRGTDIRFALVEFVGKIWKIKGVYGIPCPVEIIEEALLRSYTP